MTDNPYRRHPEPLTIPAIQSMRTWTLVAGISEIIFSSMAACLAGASALPMIIGTEAAQAEEEVPALLSGSFCFSAIAAVVTLVAGIFVIKRYKNATLLAIGVITAALVVRLFASLGSYDDLVVSQKKQLEKMNAQQTHVDKNDTPDKEPAWDEDTYSDEPDPLGTDENAPVEEDAPENKTSAPPLPAEEVAPGAAAASVIAIMNICPGFFAIIRIIFLYLAFRALDRIEKTGHNPRNPFEEMLMAVGENGDASSNNNDTGTRREERFGHSDRPVKRNDEPPPKEPGYGPRRITEIRDSGKKKPIEGDDRSKSDDPFADW